MSQTPKRPSLSKQLGNTPEKRKTKPAITEQSDEDEETVDNSLASVYFTFGSQQLLSGTTNALPQPSLISTPQQTPPPPNTQVSDYFESPWRAKLFSS
jgi:hypothetical protein